MNPDDLQRNEAIDALLDGHGIADDDPVMEFAAELASHRPQADPHFQDQLFNQLLEKRKNPMKPSLNGTIPLQIHTAPKSNISPLSLTFAAALVVLFLVSGLLFWFQNGGATNNGAALQEDASPTITASFTFTATPTITFTPTAIPSSTPFPLATPFPIDPTVLPPTLVPSGDALPSSLTSNGLLYTSLMALENIPRGTVLTEEMFTLVYGEYDDETFTDPSEMIGALILRDTAAGQPISRRNVLYQVGEVSIARVTSAIPVYTLDSGNLIITLPLRANVFYPFALGDQVNVVLNMISGDGCSRETLATCSGESITLAEKASIRQIGLSANAVTPETVLLTDTITLEVTAAEAEQLQGIEALYGFLNFELVVE